ncbi:MAG: LPS export ABC transporter periplasmic protein LptC [Winogradskyella sp.]|uniref:LPS export ABC transporter periplasmic protein LptC n=1 Tax=Winogradskyella sp. TaxID=1883156 RepID=UPI000F40100B|nr:LPS export ABC transporter periplasmic protein LptC [Winogradskyella sp.]RNC84131.1 MAG: LPS export ABC transporter periplasmic protein LptC [Winogradskyella sp.]
MRRKYLHIILNIVTALAVTMFFACKNNFKDVQQVGVLQNVPIGIADTINLKYTDSFMLRANLLSSKMIDYSNRDFGFSEFPEGIELIIYDDEGNASQIFSDYAIIYNDTDLIDLRGNVILATHKNDSLFTPQMYYDQKSEWVFTNENFRLRSEGTDVSGRGFDSDRNFVDYEMLESGGIMELDN